MTASNDAAPARLASLDALRGLAVAGMILVNDPGDPESVVGWLRHADGHGLGLADLVFPLFLFVVGASACLSLASARTAPSAAAGRTLTRIWRHVARRTGILLLLGFSLNVVLELPHFDIGGTRLPGVLQRIALCYLAAATAALVLLPPGRFAAALVLLLGYGLVLGLVPAPGYPHGGLDDPAGTLPAYVDRLLFGDRLWMGTWDPEGLLSTAPAIASALFGSVAIERVRCAVDDRHRIRELAIGAAAALVAGSTLHALQPIDKRLWTPAFAFVSTGVALVALLACVMVVGVHAGRALARPLIYLGANPLLAYLGSAVLGQVLAILPAADRTCSARGWLMRHAFAWIPTASGASLGYALAMLALWLIVARALYRRHIFLKL